MLKRSKKGFLLLEVIVAIVAISAGLVFVMRSYSVSIKAVERAGELFTFGRLLENAIFEFEEPGEVARGSLRGDFADKKYAWSLSADLLEDSSLNVVTMSTFQNKAKPGTQYSLTTYLKNKTK